MAGDRGSIRTSFAARGFPLRPDVLPDGAGVAAVGATVVVTGENPPSGRGLLAGALRRRLVLAADDSFDGLVVVLRRVVRRGLPGHHRLHRGDDLVGDLRALRQRRPVRGP